VPLYRHPEPAVQVGRGQFKSGSSNKRRSHHQTISTSDAHKWFKEYMALANTVGDLSLLLTQKKIIIYFIIID
jgi:hypothetical protein